MTGKLVFVYGTLREGGCRYGLDSLVELVHPKAYLKRFQLLHLGAFPGIVPGPGCVRGEVHLYTTFDELDGIEGFHKADPGRSLFLREKVMVEIPYGKELQASTYVFNPDSRGDSPVIESGDWFEERTAEW